MSAFVKIGTLDDFREGRGHVVLVDGERVAVFKVQGRIHAMADKCPHMGASLADGRILDGRVECHMHEWTFDLVTGEGSRRDKPWACAVVYEARVERHDVLVRRPEPEPPRPAEDDDEWVAWDDAFLKRRGQNDPDP